MATRKGSGTAPATHQPKGTPKGFVPKFRTPEPKGVRLNAGAIPKSSQYTPPEDPDPNEEAAFAALDDPGRPARRGARTPASAVSAARARMLAGRRGQSASVPDSELVLDDEDHELLGGDEEQDEEFELEREQDAPPTKKPNGKMGLSPFGDAPPPIDTDSARASAGVVYSPSVPALYCRPVMQEDTDRLWDWIRADADYGQAFLGRTFATSMALHGFIGRIVGAEQHGIAIIRAICHNEHHLGFAMLAPILAAEQTALMHLYLRKELRGQLGQFTKPLVEIASEVAPGVHLAVASPSTEAAKAYRTLLKPLGFAEYVMFVR